MNKVIVALFVVLGWRSVPSASAQVALYPTGPDQDIVAFIRFVNATSAPLDVLGQPGQPPLLPSAAPASLLFPVDSEPGRSGFQPGQWCAQAGPRSEGRAR